MNKEKIEIAWKNIEILQRKLFGLYPANNAPFEMELFLSPFKIEEILTEAKDREVIIKYVKGSWGKREIYYRNSDGTLDKVQ
jgi:hypothetical protein